MALYAHPVWHSQVSAGIAGSVVEKAENVKPAETTVQAQTRL